MKPAKLTKPTHTIAKRLTARVMVTSLVVFSVVSIIVGITVWNVGMKVGSIFYSDIADIANEKVDKVFKQVESAIINSSTAVERNIIHADRMYIIAENIVRKNPEIMGAAVAFPPNFYPEMGERFAPYAYRTPSGEIKTKLLVNDTYNHLEKDWYKIPVETGKPYWSEPYFSKEGGNISMITYSLPLKDEQGNVRAVLTADIALDWLSDALLELDKNLNRTASINFKNSNTYSFITSRDGHFVAHPNKKYIMTSAYELMMQDENNRELVDQIRERKEGCGEAVIDGKKYFIFYDPMDGVDWMMGVASDGKVLGSFANTFVICTFIILLVGLQLILLVCYLSIRHVMKPLSQFAQSADEVAQGNFDTPLPEIKSNDEMRQLHDSFATMQQSLVHQIEETRSVNEQKGRIESELRIAQNIQMSMLPKTFPPFPERNDIDIYATLKPARAVGGDLYDFYIRDNKLIFCIGDVSGKGVPASLVMAVTRALFRTASAQSDVPSHIVGVINDVMTENNEAMMFVTLIVGVLDLNTHQLSYCNAGHDAPLIIPADATEPWFLPVKNNLPVGIEAAKKFDQQETEISEGTTIFLYTDGLTEAENIDHAQFGEERVVGNSRHACNARELIETMSAAVGKFVDKAEQSDDLTMLALRITGENTEKHVDTYRLTLRNDIAEVSQLAEFVDKVCALAGFDDLTTSTLNLAMEEAVVNVIEYAYPKDERHLICIVAKIKEDELTFVISDAGVPFDPTTQPKSDISLPAEERAVGGLGIHLIREFMDTIHYEHRNNLNILTLGKRRKTENLS